MRCQWLPVLRSPIAVLSVALLTASCAAQDASSPEDARYAQLNAKMDQVLTLLDSTQQQLAQSQKQVRDLELRVQALEGYAANTQAPASVPVSPAAAGEPAVAEQPAATNTQAAIRQLQENTEVLQAEVKQHDQTKVESASKYPVKISGMLLSTTNLTDGAVDNVDLPVVSLPRNGSVAHGSLATSWRQTVVGLDARGPNLWGAHSDADVRVDFFGGQPTGGYGTNDGTVRMRTAHVNLDWSNTDLIASLDSPLISPLEPASYMTVGEPAMAWSGNLWTWSPQVELKHSFPNSGKGSTGFEVGLIDPAATASYFNPVLRQANPAESSKQPGYETRLFQTLGAGDHPLTIGVSGYYSRQKYPYHQHIDSWAGTADWKMPLTSRLELSGELYRGRALGGLGGGAFKDYVPYETANGVLGLDAEGGWTQLKARLTSSLEANAAIGQDSAFAGQVRDQFPVATPAAYSALNANRTVLGNFIFRPRAYLLFSLEYRKIMSWQVTSPANQSQTVGLAIGYLY